ncbi:MAG: enoyl-CoA hydratase/isomerase family protein [Candidatus Binatus sp.]|uniref:enoyl-CoA hydratase/isomerase family protein n=1 Tax=Candidatus Binatus sp. TaxID=2811406 RepID=UPI002720F816|nr:enoyl-CoA hydratase/isomerase family protein [Candidatus Binatus sp.]MDO8431643.1 enoyl-CoA hydratase/isomerase family protein [Candidatus Binatus sp.]
MPEIIKLEQPRDGVALVTMTNPAINNHGSWIGIAELAAAIKRAREAGARVTVLASGVPGHWFEHAWLKDLADAIEGKPTTAEGVAWFNALYEIGKTHVVTIAAVSGDCSGGGAELGWACDMRIAEEQALFAQPEIQIALTTGIGGTCRLARLIGRTATAEMVMLGRPMTARRIYQLGGVNEVVPAGKSVEVALEWATTIAARPAKALSTLKQILIDNDEMNLTEALNNEQRLFQTVAQTPEAIRTMRETQARFDHGESIRSVYGLPRSS